MYLCIYVYILCMYACVCVCVCVCVDLRGIWLNDCDAFKLRQQGLPLRLH